MDETLRTELVQWSSYYWNRVDTGDKAKVKEFLFTDTSLNSPLFNPVRGARWTLEQVKVVGTSDCDGLTALNPGWGNTDISKAFRDAMSTWKISTDSTTNATGTATHVSLIAASGVNWTTQGNLLISDKLPWSAITGTNASPTTASSISQATQNAINKLINVGSIIASASAGTSVAQSLITGEESHADKFERGVQQLLVDGGWTGDTWRVDACFGVFGSLPIVGVTFADAFVLVDSVNGSVDGPFSLSSALSSTSLLANHAEYATGTAVANASPTGCKATFRAGWWPFKWPYAPPTAPRPPSSPPGTPCIPVTPPFPLPPPATTVCLDPSVPGWMTWPACTFTAGTPGTCTCIEYGQESADLACLCNGSAIRTRARQRVLVRHPVTQPDARL